MSLIIKKTLHLLCFPIYVMFILFEIVRLVGEMPSRKTEITEWNDEGNRRGIIYSIQKLRIFI